MEIESVPKPVSIGSRFNKKLTVNPIKIKRELSLCLLISMAFKIGYKWY